MTKSLEQIQQENRKFILEAIHGCSYDKPITLSRVLLAFKNKEVKTLYKDRIIFNIEGSQFCGLQLEEEYYNSHYSLYGAGNWNLELGILEEQSKETQRAINKILKGE